MSRRHARALATFLTAVALAAGTLPAPAGAQARASVLPLAAGALPDVATVRAAIREGAGPPLPRETRVTSITGSTTDGTMTTYRDGDDERTVEQFGTLHREFGRSHGATWHLNDNGELVMDDGDDPSASVPPGLGDESRSEHVEAAPAPGTGDVELVGTGARDTVRRTFVERTTGHVVRIETVSARESTIETFDDFHTVGGSTSAWHHTVRDGDPDDVRDEQVDLVARAPIDEQQLAIPRGRAFVRFPPGASSVALPATLHDGKFVVRLTIGGRGLDFLLDTGSSAIVMDEDIAHELELPTLGHSRNVSNAGSYLTSRTIVPEIAVGPLAMHDVAIETIPHTSNDRPGVFRTVGLLGFDFIDDTKLVLDYERGTVTAYRRDAALPIAADERPFDIPIRERGQTPETDVAINGALGRRFLIDTGASGALLVFDYFAARHPEALVDEGGAPFEVRQFTGVGGGFATEPYRLKSVRLGSVDFADFVAYLVTSKTAYRGDFDGLLGSNFLRLFTVTLDYPDAAIHLTLNAAGRAGL